MKNKKNNLRAENTIQKMVANGGKTRSLAQSMREAGYSESYARNPQKIKRTQAWKEYLQEFIPDESIANTHRGLIEAKKLNRLDLPASLNDKDIKDLMVSIDKEIVNIVRNKKGVQVIFSEPDFSIRIRAVDLAYKVKGLYVDKSNDESHNEYAHLSDSELQRLITEYKGFFAKTNPLPSF